MAHILVVDDEEVISDLIIMNLNMVGFTYSQAFNGQEALEAINQMQYDCVCTDVQKQMSKRNRLRLKIPIQI
ncbi:response regulator [Anaerocolumna sp.]|uniref:response regulator n=1 Tax=Anaerocolumna sp. TaxID=2041569 RepID=UPI0028ABEE71|nr:response regulator [Anaerocolumna sp.]